MKIIYVGQLGEGGTCLDRMTALQRLGHEAVGIDQSAFEARFRPVRSIQWRWHPRWLIQEFNREILKVAHSLGRIDLVWIDKGVWVFPETLHRLKGRLGCPLVHYTPDSQLMINRSRHFIESLGIYDYLMTTKSFEVDMYRRAGAKRVGFVTQSYCPRRFANPRKVARFTRDIGFIGDYKPHYGNTVRALARGHVDIAVWGPRWVRAARFRRSPPRIVLGSGLWGEDYVNALASFKIGLGLLSKYIPEQHTTRSFEIPAAGSFLLAERTDEHLEYFEEGREAEFFSSVDEMVSKAKYYLRDDTGRLRIAGHGRLRCIQSGYDTDTVMRNTLSTIDRGEH